jgi:DNA polymerase-4
MPNQLLTLSHFPRAVVHIDGDAFFASCEQSLKPELKGRPVITGKERGIASSMSYEAKARGVKRGMRLFEIKKICPDAVILPSDYETYSLLSRRFYSIVRRFTPDVEEYGIDECFADLTGLQRPFHMSYERLAQKMKETLDTELGFTFSLGLAPNKVVAKIASKHKKPSGFTAIPGRDIHLYLANMPVEKIWGIGYQTTALLQKYNIKTALEFARRQEEWVKKYFSKPFYEIWQELNGRFVMVLQTREKNTYQTVQKMKTFSPPSCDKQFVFSQLSKNIENACIKARRYKLAAKGIIIFLRTQDFSDRGFEVRFSRPTAFPNEMIQALKPAFQALFESGKLYRSTGAILLELEEHKISQPDLFGESLAVEKMMRFYESVDKVKMKYGKHTLFLGSSFWANKIAQHEGSRGQIAERKKLLFRGESFRKRLGIPMFTGEVG